MSKKQSIYMFEGDARIEPQAIDAGTDFTSKYQSLSRVLPELFDHLELDVSLQSQERLRRMIGAMQLADGLVDSFEGQLHAEAKQLFYMVLDYATGFNDQELLKQTKTEDEDILEVDWVKYIEPLRNSLEELPRSHRAAVRRYGAQLVQIGDRKRKTGLTSYYAETLQKESALTAGILLLSLTDHERSQPQYTVVKDVLIDVITAGVLLDSVDDLVEDFEDGLHRVRPSRVNRFKLGAVAAKSVVSALAKPTTRSSVWAVHVALKSSN